jgi:dipeptidase E
MIQLHKAMVKEGKIMGAAYFFSGFDEECGFTGEISENIAKDLTIRKMLLFISSSPSGHEKTDHYMHVNKGWFDKSGIYFDEYRILDDRIDSARALGWIQGASCVFLMGGDTLAQIGFLKTNGYADTLKNCNAVIMGMSAGAINMGKTAVCSKDSYNQTTVTYEGIGIADITIEPHFMLDNTGLAAELMTLSEQHIIYGLCDNSAIIVRGDLISYLGRIYKINGTCLEPVPH